jgi:hypothetical protein
MFCLEIFGLVSNSKVRFGSLTVARLFFLVLSLGGAPTKYLDSDLPSYSYEISCAYVCEVDSSREGLAVHQPLIWPCFLATLCSVIWRSYCSKYAAKDSFSNQNKVTFGHEEAKRLSSPKTLGAESRSR